MLCVGGKHQVNKGKLFLSLSFFFNRIDFLANYSTDKLHIIKFKIVTGNTEVDKDLVFNPITAKINMVQIGVHS